MNEVTIYHQRLFTKVYGVYGCLKNDNPSYTRLHATKNEDGIHTHLHVADMEVDEYETVDGRLEEAFLKSQNDNPSSDWKLKMVRSSMVGDIFVDELSDTHWVVRDVGFKQISL